MKCRYRYIDYYSLQVRYCRCTVLKENAKTVAIRLDEFGPKGRPPGTVMLVHRKSLDLPRVLDPESMPWHKWTD